MKKILVVFLTVFLVSSNCYAQQVRREAEQIEADVPANLENKKPILRVIEETNENQELAVDSPSEKLDEGWVVRLYQTPDDLKTLGETDLGSFVWKKSPYTTLDHEKISDLSFFKGIASYLYEGYFVAEEDGQYAFAVNLTIPRLKADISSNENQLLCSYNLKFEDNTILELPLVTNKPKNGIMTLGVEESKYGNIKLEKGVYKVKQWVSCSKRWPVQVELRVRRPSDNLPKLVSGKDFMHGVR